MASGLAAIYDLVPSFGFTIAAVTLLVMIVVTPLTLKGTRSMLRMQELQPEIQRLQRRHRDDRQRLNEELLKLYKEHGVNPVGGLFPLLLQMPVFVVLYQVLRGLTTRVPVIGGNVGWVIGQSVGRGIAATAPPVVHTNFQPFFLPHDSRMYLDLAHTNVMNVASSVPLDLAQTAQEALSRSIGQALPFLVLIAIVGVTGYVQQRQSQRRSAATTPPQQQQILKVVPFIMPIVSFGLPGGLVLYLAVSNLYRIAQNRFIARSIDEP